MLTMEQDFCTIILLRVKICPAFLYSLRHATAHRAVDNEHRTGYNKLYDIYQIICFRSTELEGEKLWRSSAWKENNTPEGSSPRYQTRGYYDICAGEGGFCVKYTPFGKTEERSFDAVFFGEWLEEPISVRGV